MSDFTLIHKRDIIKGLREGWLASYADKPDTFAFLGGRTLGQVRAALAALDLETCSNANVREATGGFWPRLNECDQCGEEVDILIQLGQEPELEARWWNICAGCLNRAYIFLIGVKPKP